jgi:hypothetical protein
MHIGHQLTDMTDNTMIIKNKGQAHRVTTTTKTLQDIRFPNRVSSKKKTFTIPTVRQSRQVASLSITGMVEIAAKAFTES